MSSARHQRRARPSTRSSVARRSPPSGRTARRGLPTTARPPGRSSTQTPPSGVCTSPATGKPGRARRRCRWASRGTTRTGDRRRPRRPSAKRAGHLAEGRLEERRKVGHRDHTSNGGPPRSRSGRPPGRSPSSGCLLGCIRDQRRVRLPASHSRTVGRHPGPCAEPWHAAVSDPEADGSDADPAAGHAVELVDQARAAAASPGLRLARRRGATARRSDRSSCGSRCRMTHVFGAGHAAGRRGVPGAACDARRRRAARSSLRDRRARRLVHRGRRARPDGPREGGVRPRVRRARRRATRHGRRGRARRRACSTRRSPSSTTASGPRATGWWWSSGTVRGGQSEAYRGVNATMHSVEAMLAAYDVTG